jgi:hypothetical protein
MSVSGATQIRCVVCATQAPPDVARRSWWVCLSCNSYVCPRCYGMLRESGQESCPGAIVRGSQPHAPHFTRFLSPRAPERPPQATSHKPVVILGDVPRRPAPSKRGRAVIFKNDEPSEPATDDDAAGNDDDR